MSEPFDVVEPDGEWWFCVCKSGEDSGAVKIFKFVYIDDEATESATYDKLLERVKEFVCKFPKTEYRLFRFNDGELIHAPIV